MVPDILKMGWKGRVNIYQKRSKCTVPLKKPQIKLLLFGERQTSQDNFLFNHQMSTYISCKTLHIILGQKLPPPASYSALFQNFRRQLCCRRIRRSVCHKSKVAPNEVANNALCTMYFPLCSLPQLFAVQYLYAIVASSF